MDTAAYFWQAACVPPHRAGLTTDRVPQLARRPAPLSFDGSLGGQGVGGLTADVERGGDEGPCGR